MTNLLEEAINSNDGDHAAKVIQEALGIESDEVANYVFPKTWPSGPSGYSAWPLAIPHLPRLSPFGTISSWVRGMMASRGPRRARRRRVGDVPNRRGETQNAPASLHRIAERQHWKPSRLRHSRSVPRSRSS